MPLISRVVLEKMISQVVLEKVEVSARGAQSFQYREEHPRRAAGHSLPENPDRSTHSWEGKRASELSALFVRRCLVPPSGLCRPVWISRMTKPAEDRVAGEFN